MNTRKVKKTAGTACPSADCWQYALSNDTSTSTTGVVHAWTAVVDAGGATKTQWDFETSTASPFTGLLKVKKVLDHPTPTEKVRETVTWTQQSSSLNPYISQVETKYDATKSFEQTTKSTQVVDDYGMMTQQVQYHYGTTTPGGISRTYSTTYLRHASYVAKYILNRVTDVTVTPFNGSAVVLGQKKYDQYGGTSIGCQIWSGCGVAGIQPMTDRYTGGSSNPQVCVDTCRYSSGPDESRR